MLLFTLAKNTPCIWATFDRKHVTRNFQKSPNLVALDVYAISFFHLVKLFFLAVVVVVAEEALSQKRFRFEDISFRRRRRLSLYRSRYSNIQFNWTSVKAHSLASHFSVTAALILSPKCDACLDKGLNLRPDTILGIAFGKMFLFWPFSWHS